MPGMSLTHAKALVLGRTIGCDSMQMTNGRKLIAYGSFSMFNLPGTLSLITQGDTISEVRWLHGAPSQDSVLTTLIKQDSNSLLAIVISGYHNDVPDWKYKDVEGRLERQFGTPITGSGSLMDVWETESIATTLHFKNRALILDVFNLKDKF